MSTAPLNSEYMQLICAFPLRPINNKSQFEKAIALTKSLSYRRAKLSSAQADYLAVLGNLIAQYESRLPRLAPKMTPVEALRHLMEINGLTQTELVSLVGQKSNLSAFMNGKRGLSKAAALRLAEYFKVSPVVFLAG